MSPHENTCLQIISTCKRVNVCTWLRWRRLVVSGQASQLLVETTCLKAFSDYCPVKRSSGFPTIKVVNDDDDDCSPGELRVPDHDQRLPLPHRCGQGHQAAGVRAETRPGAGRGAHRLQIRLHRSVAKNIIFKRGKPVSRSYNNPTECIVYTCSVPRNCQTLLLYGTKATRQIDHGSG